MRLFMIIILLGVILVPTPPMKNSEYALLVFRQELASSHDAVSHDRCRRHRHRHPRRPADRKRVIRLRKERRAAAARRTTPAVPLVLPVRAVRERGVRRAAGAVRARA